MKKKPNVIWIITDQQRYDTLSINGNPNINTPNLDMLAREGVNVTQAYSGYPLCCPARGSILTSVYPQRCVTGHQRQIPINQPTIADVFNQNGYDTFYLGKWHVAGAKEESLNIPIGKYVVPRALRGGFSTWLGYENNNAQYECYLHGHNHEKEIDLFRLKKYETDALTDMFIEYLQEKACDNQPFFAVLSVQPPHDPYLAPPNNAKQVKPADIKFSPNVPPVDPIQKQAAIDLAGYFSMIENIDANVGRIVDTLCKTNLMDETHIMFFSDHGDMHGSHGQFRKMTAYQEAIHVPLIIAGEKRGTYYFDRYSGNTDVLFNNVDIAPTTLGLCGLTVPDWMEGTDLSGVRIAEHSKDIRPKSIYLQSLEPTNHPSSVNKPWRGIVTDDGYKYVCFENNDWLLFDLKSDPYELVNMAHDPLYSDLRNRLKSELQQWIEQTQDKFVLP